MNKFKKRRDINSMVSMMGKIKNPADETVATLKGIEEMLADGEKSSSSNVTSAIIDSSSVSAPTIEGKKKGDKKKEKEKKEDKEKKENKKKEEKQKEKEQQQKDIERLKQGDALKQAKKEEDLSINTSNTTSNTTDLNMDMGDSMVAKIFGKRKARKKEEQEKAREAKKYRMTAFDEPPPNYYGENDPPLPEPTL